MLFACAEGGARRLDGLLDDGVLVGGGGFRGLDRMKNGDERSWAPSAAEAEVLVFLLFLCLLSWPPLVNVVKWNVPRSSSTLALSLSE